MDKNFQYYNNLNTNFCVTAPSSSKSQLLLYLFYHNFLSEFSKPEDLELVLNNLGITQKLEILRSLLNNVQINVEEILHNYYTKNDTYSKDEVDDLVAKGHFKVVDVLPTEDIREDFIYLIADDHVTQGPTRYLQWVYDDSGWHNIGSTEIDLSDYLRKLISGENIITINGETILQGKNIDLTEYITRNELYNQLNPLKVTINVSPTIREYTSQAVLVTITVQAKKGNTNKSPCQYSVTRSHNNGAATVIGNGTNTTYIDSITEAGSYKYAVTANYSETSESATASATINIVYPTYLGFSLETNISNINLSEFNKEIKTSLSMTKSLNNTISGSYLYIITPLSNPIVATDQGFTYRVNMELAGTLNHLKYYRSTSLIDICNLTYYIK